MQLDHMNLSWIILASNDITTEGSIYFVIKPENMMVSMTSEGKLDQVAGARDTTARAGPTCCVLHPSGDELFVGTNGGSIPARFLNQTRQDARE